MSDTTIVIVARNAEATIARAVRSAREQGRYSILLVDDGSTDSTQQKAESAAGGGLIVKRIFPHRSLGYARQFALESVDTEYAALLDSDDELLPGRVAKLIHAMRSDDAQFASDGAELYDGSSGRLLRRMPVPGFLRSHRILARLFERNYLPGIGPVAFRTEWARRVGYDPEMHGAEDLDLVLRAVAAGAEFSLQDGIGYRIYAYPESLSRQLENQRRMTRRCLMKHSYSDVESIYYRAGYSARVTSWGLVSMALFREEYSEALTLLQRLESDNHSPEAVLEPDGPCPYPEGWRLNFQIGTVELLLGQPERARQRLLHAERQRETAEGCNNLGVAESQCGDHELARKLFARALERFPDYLDARLNLSTATPLHVTTHPLRESPGRIDYLPPSVH